ncbi:MAG: hypothetical protein KatS3mg054_0353 [Chloroflexus sp.]|nr:MAG: hypothetical protein KatS3mg054_0353 [Chloroflexus sp.]
MWHKAFRFDRIFYWRDCRAGRIFVYRLNTECFDDGDCVTVRYTGIKPTVVRSTDGTDDPQLPWLTVLEGQYNVVHGELTILATAYHRTLVSVLNGTVLFINGERLRFDDTHVTIHT